MTIGLTLAAAGLEAQIGVGGGRGGGVVSGQFFQQVGTIGAAGGGGLYQFANSSRAAVVGRPFSATEERKSLQTLGDGTEISSSSNTQICRDSQGRTRTEPDSANLLLASAGVKGNASVEIVDPVARMNVTLNPAAKTAVKTPFPGSPDMTFSMGQLSTSLSDLATALRTLNAATVTSGSGVGGGRGGRGGRGGADNTLYEELGVQSQNGVLATGTRTTLTIPQGEIGNNRDIHVVNEQWYSEDLQMLVKTVNSDPRFGENTYQLTNISRVEPDPALFQIPPDYTIIDPGAGRGRGGRGVQTPAKEPAIH
jgi:hypothetical protein